MPILDAALAFSLTMLVVASIVTMLVSAIHWILRARRKRVKQMIADFLEKEVVPVADREIKRLSAQLAEDGVEAIRTQAVALAGEARNDVFARENLDQMAKLTTSDLKEELKRSPLGGELLTHLGDRAEPVFDEFAKRYEAVAGRYALKFRSDCRWMTTIFALIVAVGLNIDSFFILDCYLKNQAARDIVVGQMDAILETYETRVAAAVTSLNATESESGLAATEPTASGDSVEEFKAAYRETSETIESLLGFGLPVGWEYFPYSQKNPLMVLGIAKSPLETEPVQAGVFTDDRTLESPGDLAKWFAGIILTGLLAGVGAPFWYDLVTGISRARDRQGGTAQSSSP